MKTLFVIYLFLSTSLFASTLNMNYIGELSLYGKVGNAAITYTNDGKKYHIEVKGGGSGLIARLTSNKKYIYESIGRVENGELIPMQYIARETSRDSNKTKTYLFDYENEKITETRLTSKKKEISTFNIYSMSYDTRSEIVEKTRVKILEEFYKDDMVSMFFNKRLMLLSMNENETKLIHAVGSKDMQKGMVVKLIKIENGKYTYSINIQKDYLSSGSEDATFILDSDNILHETKLAGIMFFGDASIRRLY